MKEQEKKKVTKSSRLQWIATVSQAIPIMFHRYGMTGRVDEFSRAIYWMATMSENYIANNPQIFDEIEYHASEIVKNSIMPR